MTEAEWLACDDASRMLDWEICNSHRKWRLFNCACCRLIWHNLDDPRSKAGVESSERFADGSVTQDDLLSAFSQAHSVVYPQGQHTHLSAMEWGRRYAALSAITAAAVWIPDDGAELVDIVQDTILHTLNAGRHLPSGVKPAATAARLADLARDIIGNPFRHARVDPARRTSTAVSLAQAAYDERILPSGELEPARLAVLADALEEAGCTDETILSHLRSPGPHLRGCWALDLVLGKE